MTAFCPSLEMFGFHNAGVGVSAEAGALRKSIMQSVDHYLEPRLDLLMPEIEGLGTTTEENQVVADPETVGAAVRFAYCLPRFGPLPEVSVDPDGEIAFDWIGPSGGKMFSVSVNKQDRLAFAGWFGEKSRIHGIEQLVENCPPEIVRGIRKATHSENGRVR